MENKGCSNSSAIMNWSELHPELLVLISQKLADTFDFVSFRATCRGWRSAVSAVDNASQVPLIASKDIDFSKGDFTFYRLSSGSLVKIKFTRFCDKNWFYGYSYYKGYFLVVDATSSILSLINPLTKGHTTLPSIPFKYAFCEILGIEFDKDGIPKFIAILAQRRRHLLDFSTLCCFHVGDEKWTIVYDVGDMYYSTWKYYKFKFFVSDPGLESIYGFLCIENITRQVSVHKLPAPPSLSWNCSSLDYNSYLQFCFNQDGLLGIIVTTFRSPPTNVHFEVYRLETENENVRWLKTTNIGDHTIFCSDDIEDCQISKPGNLSGFKGNSIYFLRRYCKENYLGRFDIEKGTIQEIMQCPDDAHIWFFPNLV